MFHPDNHIGQWWGDTTLTLPLFWWWSTVSPVFLGRYPWFSIHSFVVIPPPTPPPVLVPNKHPCLCGRQAIIYGHGGQATENAGGSWYRCLKVEEEANPPFSVSVLCVCLSLSVSVSLMTIYTLGNFELFFSFQACKLFHSKRWQELWSNGMVELVNTIHSWILSLNMFSFCCRLQAPADLLFWW